MQNWKMKHLFKLSLDFRLYKSWFTYHYEVRLSWSYGSWIYNYLCNQCLSSLMWVRIQLGRGVLDTVCDKVCQWLAAGLWFSRGTPVSSTNKCDCHDITENMLKVALNTIKCTMKLLVLYKIKIFFFLPTFTSIRFHSSLFP